MGAVKNWYINTLNSLSEEEQVELGWDMDKYRDSSRSSSLSANDIIDIF